MIVPELDSKLTSSNFVQQIIMWEGEPLLFNGCFAPNHVSTATHVGKAMAVVRFVMTYNAKPTVRSLFW